MSINGFIKIDGLVDNTNDVIHPIGELSNYSLSASIEKSNFSDQIKYPGIELITFRNRGEISNPVLPPPTFADASPILELAAWVWLQANTGYATDNEVLFLQTVTQQYGTKLANITIGNMVTDGAYWIPEWIRYQPKTTNADSTVSYGEPVRIWFADSSFRRQYSQYDIAIISPIDNLDDLHGNKNTIKNLIEARTAEELSAKIREKAGNVPYTLTNAQSYDWIDKTDTTFKVPTAWWVVIWGPAGNNPDLIRDEIVAYILANSKYSRAEWEKVLPDLFISTEYIFVPNWDQYSIENQTLQAGLYSPLFNPAEALTLMKRGAPTYDDDHIRAHARTASLAYRSLGFVVTGGIRNRDGIYDFYTKWKDYIAFATTHVDFNRLQPKTQEWVLKFYDCVLLAESMTTDSEVPEGFARIKRNGIIYAEFTFEKIQYLVVTKIGLSKENVELVTEAPETGTWIRVVGGWIETLSAEEFINALDSAVAAETPA